PARLPCSPRAHRYHSTTHSRSGGERLVAGVDLLLALLDLAGEALLLGLCRGEPLADLAVLLAGLLELALGLLEVRLRLRDQQLRDRKSTRLNCSHASL